MDDYYVIEPCTTANGVEIKLKDKRIDLGKAEEAAAYLGSVLASSPVVLLTRIKGYSVSIYASGRLMVKSDKKISEKEADKLAKEILTEFEKEGAII